MKDGALTLTKKFLVVDACWEWENPFSLVECHWVYQPHSRSCSISRDSWPIQSEFSVVCLLDWFCGLSVSVCFVFTIFCLIDFFITLIFTFVDSFSWERERKYIVGCLGNMINIWEDFGKDNYMIKIYYVKVIKEK